MALGRRRKGWGDTSGTSMYVCSCEYLVMWLWSVSGEMGRKGVGMKGPFEASVAPWGGRSGEGVALE